MALRHLGSASPWLAGKGDFGVVNADFGSVGQRESTRRAGAGVSIRKQGKRERTPSAAPQDAGD